MEHGHEVVTAYGWGRIETILPEDRLVVALDWSQGGVRSKAILYTNVAEVRDSSFCSVGTCVLTKYGTGILLDYKRQEGHHVVRLWSPYSGSGSATAYMRKADIIKVIKAAVGFQVLTPYGVGVVLRYRVEDDMYIVRLDYGIAHLSADNVKCKQAKFLPAAKLLLDKLVARNLASAVSTYVPPLSGEISASDWIVNAISQFSSNGIDLEAMASSATNISAEDLSGLKTAFMAKAKQRLAEVNVQQSLQAVAARFGAVLPEGSSAAIESTISSVAAAASSGDYSALSLEAVNSSGSGVPPALLEWLKSNVPEQYKAAVEAAADAITYKQGLSLRSYLSVSAMEKLLVEVVMRLWSVYRKAGPVDEVVASVQKYVGTVGTTTNISTISGQIMSIDISAIGAESFTEEEAYVADDFEAYQLVDMLESTAAGGVGAILTPKNIIAAITSALTSNAYIQGLNMEPFASFLHQFVGTPENASLESIIASLTSSLSLEDTGKAAQQFVSSTSGKVNDVIKTLKEVPSIQRALQKFEGIDINAVISASIKDPENLLSVAEKALLDEETRSQMIAQVSDQVLDFLLDLVPSLTIPDLEGIQDDIQYSIAGLDLSGLAFKKEGVSVKMAGIGDISSISGLIGGDSTSTSAAAAVGGGGGGGGAAAGTPLGSASPATATATSAVEFISFEASGISARFSGIKWSYAQTYFPHLKGDGSADASVENATLKLGFRLVRLPRGATALLSQFREVFIPAINSSTGNGEQQADGTAAAAAAAAAQSALMPLTPAQAAAMAVAQKKTAAELFDKFPLLRDALIASVEQNAALDDDDGGSERTAGRSASSHSSGRRSLPGQKKKRSKEKENESVAATLKPDSRAQLRWLPPRVQNLSDPTAADAETAEKEVEPILVMSSPQLEISKLNLSVEKSSTAFAWLYNLIVSIFGEVIRGYVVSSIVDSLATGSGSLIGVVNGFAAQYWPQIESLLQIKTTSLPEATCEDLYSVLGPEAYAGLLEEALTGISYTDLVLPFPAPGSLGLRIDVRTAPVTAAATAPVTPGTSNQHASPYSKGYIAVVGCLPGSQAEHVFVQTRLRLGPSKSREDSAAIKAVNGRDVTHLSTDDTVELMKDQSRPLLITVSVPQGVRRRSSAFLKIIARYKRQVSATHNAEAVARNRESRTGSSAGAASAGGIPHTIPAAATVAAHTRKLRAVRVLFQAGPLGLKLRDTKSCGGAVIVTGFARGPNNEVQQAEAKNCLTSGMIMLAIGGEVIFGRPFDVVMSKIQASGRPMEMIFVPSPDSQLSLDKYPADLMVANIENYIMVTSVGESALAATEAAAAAAEATRGTPSEGQQVKAGEVAAAQEVAELKPGVAIIQVAKALVNGAETPAAQAIALIEQSVPCKIAIRDIDAFMHLIRIRDGHETLQTHVEYSTDEVVSLSASSSPTAAQR